MAINYIPFNKTAEFEMGSEGEQIVKELLQKNGWFVIPSYAYTGPENDKAPKMEGTNTYFVIPDLDICKVGTRRWIEVKTKTEADYTRITQRFEHGIPLRHYYHYLEVQKESGCPVWLFVYELRTKTLLYASLNSLSHFIRKYEGNKMSKGGMAFFPRDKFINWDEDSYLFARTDHDPKRNQLSLF